MSKQVDVVTISRGISAETQMQVREELNNHLKNGFELFSTHYAGIVGPELMMVYVMVKSEELTPQVAPAAVDAPVVVAKKRGRPAKAALVDSDAAEE